MPEAVTMEAILTQVGTFLTQAITWMGNVLETIVSEPALLLMVIAMPVAGFAVGLLNRLIRVG